MHAELGEVVNVDKAGREGNEVIVVDLTGHWTGCVRDELSQL